MAQRLLCFDIDLTLIFTGGAGMQALGQAFCEVTGHSGALVPIRPDGKTDPALIPELFAANGHVYRPDHYEAVIRRYLDLLEATQLGDNSWVLLPGVVELLEAVAAAADLYPVLLTGNDERGARLKLKPFDLNRFFSVGAFGSDSARRADLVPLAIRRASAYYERQFDKKEVIVIGDSEGDVACAAANGVRCLAVQTGFTDAAALRAAGFCTIVQDLSDTRRMMDFFRE